MPKANAQRTTAQDVLRAAAGNHLWLNAMLCHNPTPEFCEQLGRDVLELLNSRDNLLPKFNPDIEQESPTVQKALDEMSQLTPVLYLSINKS